MSKPSALHDYPDLGWDFLGVALQLCNDAQDSNVKATFKEALYRRTVSSAYYAVFHVIARSCADGFVGDNPTHRNNRAWVEVYRGLEHGKCHTTCQQIQGSNDEFSKKFPDGIKDVANVFCRLRILREKADYAPEFRVTRAEVLSHISEVLECYKKMRTVKPVDKCAFAACLLIDTRGAKSSRFTHGQG